MSCRVCGCSDHAACVDPVFGACWWVEPNLCSHCVAPEILLKSIVELERRGQLAGVPDGVALVLRKVRATFEYQKRQPGPFELAL